jgi:hypothetical protein
MGKIVSNRFASAIDGRGTAERNRVSNIAADRSCAG